MDIASLKFERPSHNSHLQCVEMPISRGGSGLEKDMNQVTSGPGITNMPPEILQQIACQLDAESYANLRLTCTKIRSALPTFNGMKAIAKSRFLGQEWGRLLAEKRVGHLIDTLYPLIQSPITVGLCVEACADGTKHLLISFISRLELTSTVDGEEGLTSSAISEFLTRLQNALGTENLEIARYQTDGSYLPHPMRTLTTIQPVAAIDTGLIDTLFSFLTNSYDTGQLLEKLLAPNIANHFCSFLAGPHCSLEPQEWKPILAQYPELMDAAVALHKWAPIITD